MAQKLFPSVLRRRLFCKWNARIEFISHT